MSKYLIILLLLLIPSSAFPDAARDSIKTGANDCDSTGDGGGFSNSRAGAYFGLYQGDDFSASFLFDDVVIPQGATINSAVLGLYANEEHLDQTILLKIAAVDADDASAFTQASDFENPTLTIAKTDWDIDTDDDLAFEEYYTSADISAVIQEIVDRVGWSSGNNINIVIYDDGSSGDNARSTMTYENESSALRSSKLIIDFAPAVEKIGGPTAFGVGNPTDPDGRAVWLNLGASNKIATRFYNTYAGTLDSISVGLSDSGDPDTIYVHIHSDNAGEPNTLLATSVDSAEVNTGDTDEEIFTLAVSTSLTEDTYYWLGFGNSAGSDINYSYLSGAAGGAKYYTDLRPYDANWNTVGDINPSTELLAIAYITPADSVRHLWPEDDGGHDEWCPIADCWERWLDPGSHDSSGTVLTMTQVNKAQSVVLPNWSEVGGDGSDIIDSVILILVAKESFGIGGSANMIPYIYDGTDSLHSPPLTSDSLSEHFADTTYRVFETAPDGGEWTITDIDNLQIGIDETAVSTFGNVSVTQLHARVYYQPAEVVVGEISVRRRKVILSQ